MARTLLGIVQEHCRRTGLPSPQNVVSNPDRQISQMWGLLNEMLEDQVFRRTLQQLTREHTWTATAAEDQGNIYTLTGDEGFINILPNTFFDRSSSLPIYYGLTPSEWQELKTNGALQGPAYQARLQRDRLKIIPMPSAGHTLAFEYRTNALVLDADTSGYKVSFTKDTDTFVLPDSLAVAWLRWRWKAEKGLDYSEERVAYESLRDALGFRDGGPKVLNMGQPSGQLASGVVVPIGSWQLP